MALKSRIKKLLVGAAAVVALGSFAAPTQAASFAIELTVTGGLQAPAGPFYGSFELPTYTGVGPEVFVGDGSKDGPINAFIVSITADVSGTPETIDFEEDEDPSLFEITFNDGTFLAMDFLSKVVDPFDLGIGDTWSSFLKSDESLVYEGTVDVTLVPVPAALPLFATALGMLAGVGVRRRRVATGLN